MKNTWFWLKFTFLLFFTISLGIFNLPPSFQSKLPPSIQQTINAYKIKLGIDLSGGTKLEYKIDFSEAEQKLGIASENNNNPNTPSLKKSEIAAGVVKTLKKRIDPDGTKEVAVFSSHRGNDWFVTVELTSDIDTPENRAKLAKVTSLEFKTPRSLESIQQEAKKILENAIEKKQSFDAVALPLTKTKEGRVLNLEDAFLDEVTNATFGDKDLAKKLITQNPDFVGWDPAPQYFPNGITLLTYYTSPLKQKERVSLHAKKSFSEAAKKFPVETNLSIDQVLEKTHIKEIKELSNLAEGDANVYGSDLIKKEKFDSKTGKYLYSLINLSTLDQSAREEYKLKEVPHTEDARSLRFLYLSLSPWAPTALDGGKFKVAKVGTDKNTGKPVVNIEFTQEGGKIFGQITGELAKHTNTICGKHGDQFAMFVDHENISAPCVRERINGNAQISLGGKNIHIVKKEAMELAEKLNSGATPAPIHLTSERKISASLGAQALSLSLKAAIIGFTLVSIWMLFFFRFAGFLAIVALGFYALLLISLFKYFGFVLTLSGVAGVILSIGMAVDANVLIYERIKEELKKGESFDSAVMIGFDKAWSSIRDSNISSLITCFILFALGTSIIKAFSITLALGIIVSMFTAITFTRYLIIAITPKKLKKTPSLFIGLKD